MPAAIELLRWKMLTKGMVMEPRRLRCMSEGGGEGGLLVGLLALELLEELLSEDMTRERRARAARRMDLIQVNKWRDGSEADGLGVLKWTMDGSMGWYDFWARWFESCATSEAVWVESETSRC